MKSIHIFIFTVLLSLVTHAQNEPPKPEFVKGEIIVSYELSYYEKSLSSTKSLVENEYNTLANTLSDAVGVKMVSKAPVCNWLVKQMVNENKPEESFIEQTNQPNAASKNKHVKLYQQLVLKVDNDEIIDSLVKVLTGKTYNNYKIRYACRNQYYYTDEEPNDSLYAQQWSHKVTNADSTWNIQNGSSDVVIGIIDGGVDYLHQDLKENMVPGYDFVDLDIDSAEIKANPEKYAPGEDYLYPDDDPMDFGGHGTHCAGIAVAKANNGIGVVGVAPNCKVMPLRAGFSFMGRGKLSTDFIVSAVMYAANNDVDIISMSFGGGAENEALAEAIEYAHSNGIILVASAGNSNSQSKQYPAGYEHVVSVGSTTKDDEKSNFSNYGKYVDIMAPGSKIVSTFPMNFGLRKDSLGYGILSGTSMACPYVAGALALLQSYKPLLPKEEIVATLLNTADNIDSLNLGHIRKLGFGRVNVLNLLTTSSKPNILLKSTSQKDTMGNDLYLVEPGQTVQIIASFQNTWQPVDPVTFALTSDDPYVSVIQKIFTVDSMKTNQMVSNNDMPFVFKIDDAVPDNYTIKLQFEVSYNDEVKKIPFIIITSIEHEFNVPADYATIQEAIDSAAHGDVILVEPGEYFENINFKGKNLTLASKYLSTNDPSHIASTIINGSNAVDSVSNDDFSGSTVYFANGENRAAKLIGFTITGGSGTNKNGYFGGGIYCENSSPHLEALVITKNEIFVGTGVGIYMNNCTIPPLLKDLTLSNSKSVALIAAYDGTFKADGLNISKHQNGHILYLSNVSAKIKDISITDCSSNRIGFSITGGDSVVIENAKLTGLKDGIRIKACNYLELNEVEIKNNVGFGLYSTDLKEVHISNSEFVNNEVRGISLTRTESAILDNTVIQKSRKGLHILACDQVRLLNSVVSDCFEYSGVFISQSNADLINVTVANNFSENYRDGAGVFVIDSKVNLINSIVFHNTWYDERVDNTFPSSVYFTDNSDSSWLRVAYTNLEGGLESFNNEGDNRQGVVWLAGNLNTPPSFLKPDQADYHLAENSPMIGKGANYFEYEAKVLVKLDSAEYIGNMPDMGAYINYNSFVKADFDVNTEYGALPLAVEFENKSYSYKSEMPDSFIWVFSQKDTVYDANPSFTFNEEGWHSVELIALNDLMSDSKTKQKLIYTFAIDSFYVDVQGSDTIGTGSVENPFKSIQHAVNMARKNDVVIVNPGTYYEQVKLEGEEFVLASRFLLNGDTSFISSTIIDGNKERENVLTIANQATGETRIIGLTFQNAYQTNKSKQIQGAGVFCDYSSPIISNCTIKNNTGYSKGGGMYLRESEARIENCLIEGNKTTGSFSDGGGIAVTGGEPYFENIRVVNNTSCEYGGGMYLNAGKVTINRSIVAQNEVSDSTVAGYGGGICYRFGSLFIDNSRIESNAAADDGGGVFLENVKATIDNSYIGKNKAGQSDNLARGGGVFIKGKHLDEESRIKQTVFESNRALNEGGAIYCGKDAETKLHGVTLFKNKSVHRKSGAVFIDENSNSKVLSSILWENQPGQIELGTSVDSTQAIMYSSIQGGFNGKGNIDLNPIFVDTAKSDFSLNVLSPCIDAGSRESDTDPDGSVADMGAFFFDQTIPVFLDSLPNITLCSNDMLTVTANVRGAGKLYYEWYKDGWLLAEGNPLYFKNVYLGYAGKIYCVVKNKKRDSATSNKFMLDIISPNEVRVDTTICEGDSYLAAGEMQSLSGLYTDIYTNVHGCDSIVTTNLKVSVCTSIPNVETGIKVYPNPSTGIVRIEADNFKEAQIYNLQGGWIKTFKTTVLNLGILPKGSYLLIIAKENGMQESFQLFLTD